MGGDEAALHQITALNEALTLAVSLLRVAVGAVRSKRTGQPFRSPVCEVGGCAECTAHAAAREGERNGNYRHGARTKATIELRRFIKSLRRQ
jgi:hypothetical protein